MTKLEQLNLAEPVEAMYIEASYRIIVNLARHFATGKDLPLSQWQVTKLAEMGKLTEETVKIIADSTGQREEVIRASLEAAAGVSVAESEAAIGAAGGGVVGSQSMQTYIGDLTAQAMDSTNLVNTVMLQSTRGRYLAAISQVMQTEEALRIEQLTSSKNLDMLSDALDFAQNELNQAAVSVTTGVSARTTALRTAVHTLADKGIAGFVDSAGREWTPEAYVNMDIRTTVHNASIGAAKALGEDLGTQIFQVSSHPAARPLCAPYQGRFFSWDGTSGVVQDLNGNEYPYSPIESTSYGQAAGLFGINCGHHPLPFQNGISVPTTEPLETEAQKEQNAREYDQRQKQRALERRVRKAKTEAAAYKAAGDNEGFASASLRVKQAEANLKAYADENNLTLRVDRTWVGGYNKSVASAANQAARKLVTRRIDLDDLEQVTYGTGVQDEVRDAIGSTMKRLEERGGFSINYVGKQMANSGDGGTSVFEVEPVSYGRGPSLLRLNVNTEWLAGKSLAEIDSEFAKSQGTYANTLEEALIHESGHAKLIHGLSVGEIQKLYEELNGRGVQGLSYGARRDGAEAMADIEISLYRGEKLTEEQQALYDKYKR